MLKRLKWRILLVHLTLLLSTVVVAAPLIYAFLGSTQNRAEAYAYPPRIAPGSGIVQNFQQAWKAGLGRMMLNSTWISISVTVGKTALALLAALALVYFAFPWKNLVFFFILVTLMMPVPVRIVPLFNLAASLKLGDSYWALILPFLASATGTFLFRQHFMSIPHALVDAARIDGTGPLRFLIKILVPMSWNTIGALAVIEFVYMWNQYLWPLLIINSPDKQVIQIGLKLLRSPEEAIQWGMVMAGSVMAILPPLLLFLLLQEQFMHGFALSEEK